MAELLLGLLVTGGILLLAVVLPIVSFVRASEARRTADALRDRVRELEAAVARLGGTPMEVPAPSPPLASPVITPARPMPAALPVLPLDQPANPESPIAPPAAPVIGEPSSLDLEQRIGSRWLLYAGIAAVVLGTSYFVKFAFDNGWVSEPLRVAAGTAAGLGLLAAGQRFSARGLPLFGQALAGGGILILYLSIYAALHFYRLVSPGPAFALMAAVTAAAAWLADRQRAQVLAVLALLGGFATPLLVGGGRGAQVVLFTYIALLVSGTAVLSRRRGWPLLAGGSYAATLALVVAWFFDAYQPAWWLRTELFLTLYAALFVFMLRSLFVSGQRTTQAHLAIAALATAPLAYHVASISLLSPHPSAWLVYIVLVTIAGLTAAERTGSAWLRLAVSLLVGIPTFAWLMALRDPRWYAASVGTVVTLYVLHLVSQWQARDDDGAGPAAQAAHAQVNGLLLPLTLYWFLEQHAPAWSAWTLAALAAWNAGLAALTRRRASAVSLSFTALAATLTAATIVAAAEGPAVAAGWAAEGVFLGWLAMRERSRLLGWSSSVLVVLGALLIMAHLAQPPAVGELAVFNPRALAAAVVIALLGWLAWRMGSDPAAEVRGGARDALMVLVNLLGVLWLSAEIQAFYEPLGADVAFDAGLAEQLTLSVSWALYAVVLIALGIRRGYAPARYFAIALFGITIAKVLLNDIAGLDRLYRMLTVLGVGVLLLVASYLYQRRAAPPGPAR